MLNILYQDNDLLALNKPSGTLSVPGKIPQSSLLEQTIAEFPNARIVHRLDMATSGVILFALNYETQKHLGQQFESRRIRKNYVAVVNGIVNTNNGEVSAPLICDWPNRPKQKVDWQQGKSAQTKFEVLERQPSINCSRMQLTPITGRSHQLRVHMQHIGHPIVGDPFYGHQEAKNKASRLLLHAQRIEFVHPSSKGLLSITCDADF